MTLPSVRTAHRIAALVLFFAALWMYQGGHVADAAYFMAAAAYFRASAGRED